MRTFIQMHQLLAFGLGISALYASVMITILVWAIRSGQFSNQDHARYLPLEAREIGEKQRSEPQRSEPQRSAVRKTLNPEP